MRISKEKLLLAMARACMDTRGLAEAAQLPRPTLNNAIIGRSVRPSTLGHIAKALGIDPAEIIEKEG